MSTISLIFGILPESIFFALFFIFAKNLRKRRIPLFTMIFALNLGLSYLFAFTVYYHALFITGIYAILYLLYHSHIIDIFLITTASLILTVIGYLCFYGISNYAMAAIGNRILLFLFLIIVHKKLNSFYTVYKNHWNRSDDTRIKSITARNISCIVLNLLIYFLLLSISSHMLAVKG